ncbi:unnamed protein product, partial [Ectocarpus sp. 12 AP-2014]
GGGISTLFLNRYVLARDKEMDFANTFREQKIDLLCVAEGSLFVLLVRSSSLVRPNITTM